MLKIKEFEQLNMTENNQWAVFLESHMIIQYFSINKVNRTTEAQRFYNPLTTINCFPLKIIKKT